MRKGGFLRKLFVETLEAVGFLHDRGIVHRSLGPASLLVNTLDENFPENLDVKIRDLGFAQQLSDLDDASIRKAREKGFSAPDAISRYFQSEDLKALGFTFMEIIFSYLGTAGQPSLGETFKRLFEDVYDRDIESLRSYCEAEELWALGNRLLDDKNRAGWDLIEKLINADRVEGKTFTPASVLRAQHPFFAS